MKVSTERIESNQVVLNVEVDSETVEKSLNQAHKRLASRLNIPGFRRGKAPRAMVERFVGRPALLEEALDRLVPELYQQILKDEDIDAVAQPKFEVIELEPVTFKAVVPVRPAVDLGDYRVIRVELDSAEVSDEQVNETLESLREQQAVFEPVDRPAEMGDQVTIDVKGTRDGEQILDQENLDYPLVAELRVPVPGFAEHLVGMSRDETKEFDVAFAEDAEETEVAGKSFHFTVTVHEVKGKRLPELNDEFAREIGEDFSTLADLRERIRSNLTQRKLSQQSSQAEEKAVEAALERAQLELPPGLVEREVESLAEERERVLAAQRVSMEDYLRFTQQTPEQLREELEAEAQKRLRRRFVLEEIAKQEGLEATEDEVKTELSLAAAAEDAAHAGHKHPRRNLDRPEIRSALAEVIRRRKALQWLVETATEGKLKQTSEEPTANAAGSGVPATSAAAEEE